MSAVTCWLARTVSVKHSGQMKLRHKEAVTKENGKNRLKTQEACGRVCAGVSRTMCTARDVSVTKCGECGSMNRPNPSAPPHAQIAVSAADSLDD